MEDNESYNSAVVIEPNGSINIIRKRGNSVYNDKENLPFISINTTYGKIVVVICSDTYLMDWVRVLKLNGADIVITPANWWCGDYQLNLWSTRAKENGVSLIVSNRWG